MLELPLLLPLLIWLLVSMVYDLRYRELPANLTMIPLALAGIYALLMHGAWISVGFAAALILISDLEPRQRRLLFAGVIAAFVVIFEPAAFAQIIILLTIWLLWDFGAMGGADAKLLFVIGLTVQQPVVFVLIALAGGIQGLVALLLHRKEIPFVVAIFVGVAIFALDQLVLKIL
ncbi:type IV leader peptidase family [Longilinea arvoryzae]|uniref:Type IV leader peptidase family n=1 Tax=Longilinea arvoryzae TaxID=360412 RepID=A0A0S7BF89_9CHLR|nr:prepilin peptidase [Longilinea arvoryzae]GAP13219.1 type IV leader peptidase family [Longilinea arvoryzae]